MEKPAPNSPDLSFSLHILVRNGESAQEWRDLGRRVPLFVIGDSFDYIQPPSGDVLPMMNNPTVGFCSTVDEEAVTSMEALPPRERLLRRLEHGIYIPSSQPVRVMEGSPCRVISQIVEIDSFLDYRDTAAPNQIIFVNFIPNVDGGMDAAVFSMMFVSPTAREFFLKSITAVFSTMPESDLARAVEELPTITTDTLETFNVTLHRMIWQKGRPPAAFSARHTDYRLVTGEEALKNSGKQPDETAEEEIFSGLGAAALSSELPHMILDKHLEQFLAVSESVYANVLERVAVKDPDFVESLKRYIITDNQHSAAPLLPSTKSLCVLFNEDPEILIRSSLVGQIAHSFFILSRASPEAHEAVAGVVMRQPRRPPANGQCTTVISSPAFGMLRALSLLSAFTGAPFMPLDVYYHSTHYVDGGIGVINLGTIVTKDRHATHRLLRLGTSAQVTEASRGAQAVATTLGVTNSAGANTTTDDNNTVVNSRLAFTQVVNALPDVGETITLMIAASLRKLILNVTQRILPDAQMDGDFMIERASLTSITPFACCRKPAPQVAASLFHGVWAMAPMAAKVAAGDNINTARDRVVAAIESDVKRRVLRTSATAYSMAGLIAEAYLLRVAAVVAVPPSAPLLKDVVESARLLTTLMKAAYLPRMEEREGPSPQDLVGMYAIDYVSLVLMTWAVRAQATAPEEVRKEVVAAAEAAAALARATLPVSALPNIPDTLELIMESDLINSDDDSDFTYSEDDSSDGWNDGSSDNEEVEWIEKVKPKAGAARPAPTRSPKVTSPKLSSPKLSSPKVASPSQQAVKPFEDLTDMPIVREIEQSIVTDKAANNVIKHTRLASLLSGDNDDRILKQVSLLAVTIGCIRHLSTSTSAPTPEDAPSALIPLIDMCTIAAYMTFENAVSTLLELTRVVTCPTVPSMTASVAATVVCELMTAPVVVRHVMGAASNRQRVVEFISAMLTQVTTAAPAAATATPDRMVMLARIVEAITDIVKTRVLPDFEPDVFAGAQVPLEGLAEEAVPWVTTFNGALQEMARNTMEPLERVVRD